MIKTELHISEVNVLGGDNLYTCEINNGDYIQREVFCAETIQELIRTDKFEMSYNEEFETKEGLTIEQAIDSDYIHYMEIDYNDGLYDVYLHKVTVKHGDISYDLEGEFISSYKTEKGAINKKNKLMNFM